MTIFTATNAALTCPPVRRRLSAYATLAQFHAVWRQRRALKSLDTAALDDIGVTRAQASAEASRPIWNAPASWRH